VYAQLSNYSTELFYFLRAAGNVEFEGEGGDGGLHGGGVIK